MRAFFNSWLNHLTGHHLPIFLHRSYGVPHADGASVINYLKVIKIEDDPKWKSANNHLNQQKEKLECKLVNSLSQE